MTDWPSYKRARDLAGAVFLSSEAMILQLARQHGVGRKAGRCIGFEKVRHHGKQRLARTGLWQPGPIGKSSHHPIAAIAGDEHERDVQRRQPFGDFKTFFPCKRNIEQRFADSRRRSR